MKKNYLRLLLIFVLTGFISCELQDIINKDQNQTNGKSTAIFNTELTYDTMTDQDGNVYKTIVIGTQTWMAENLRTKKFSDGTFIEEITDSEKWKITMTPAVCTYNNTKSADSIATFGRLYNWYAVNSGKLAPDGWRVPSTADFNTMLNFLGGQNNAGYKLMEPGSLHWNNQMNDVTNSSGFTALPAGFRYESTGKCQDLRKNTGYWTSNEYDLLYAYLRSLGGSSGCFLGNMNKKNGYSVRLVKN